MTIDAADLAELVRGLAGLAGGGPFRVVVEAGGRRVELAAGPAADRAITAENPKVESTQPGGDSPGQADPHQTGPAVRSSSYRRTVGAGPAVGTHDMSNDQRKRPGDGFDKTAAEAPCSYRSLRRYERQGYPSPRGKKRNKLPFRTLPGKGRPHCYRPADFERIAEALEAAASPPDEIAVGGTKFLCTQKALERSGTSPCEPGTTAIACGPSRGPSGG